MNLNMFSYSTTRRPESSTTTRVTTKATSPRTTTARSSPPSRAPMTTTPLATTTRPKRVVTTRATTFRTAYPTRSWMVRRTRPPLSFRRPGASRPAPTTTARPFTKWTTTTARMTTSLPSLSSSTPSMHSPSLGELLMGQARDPSLLALVVSFFAALFLVVALLAIVFLIILKIQNRRLNKKVRRQAKAKELPSTSPGIASPAVVEPFRE